MFPEPFLWLEPAHILDKRTPIESSLRNNMLTHCLCTGLYTYTPNSDLYNIDYTDITYATDDFQIPGRDGLATLGDVPFVAYTNTTGTGNYSIAGIDDFDYQWIGLGLATGQAIVYSPYTDGKPWPTFAQHFMNASLIESNTYSIWLDSPSQKTGHLLLGGLNSKRYKGSLVNLPTSLNVTSTQYGLKLQSVLSVGIESFSANGKVIPNTTVQNAILAHDSSTYLPPEVALEIWDAVGAIYDPNSGNLDKLEPQVPCSYLTNASTISLTFTGSNLTLPIPMSAITVKGGNGPLRDSGPYADTCQILIRYVRLGLPAMLGSNVLRELYTVYDFENKAISVALTDFDAKEDNVIAIPVGGVAGIKKEAFGNDTASGNGTSSDPNATTEGQIPVDRETTVPDSGSGNGVAIGVGVAVPIVVIAGLAAAFFLWRRRKAAKDKALAKGDGNDGNEVHAKAELADDQKPHAEAMGNEVFEVGDDGTYKHELESPEARKQELAAEQRHELA